MEVQYHWAGDFTDPVASRIKQSYNYIPHHNVLDEYLLRLPGGSGYNYRKMINNLVSITPDPRYLEVGCLYGSTACATLYRNKLSATCIDNFSWNNKEWFMANIKAVTNGGNIDCRVIENDFRKVDYNSIGKHNIYMFDGPHLEQDQYDGVAIVQNALDDCFTLIVDDYNDGRVQRGTQNAIKDLGLKEVASLTIITPEDYPRGQNSDWHFGYYIAVLKKP